MSKKKKPRREKILGLGDGVQDMRQLAERGNVLVNDAVAIVASVRNLLAQLQTSGVSISFRNNELIIKPHAS